MSFSSTRLLCPRGLAVTLLIAAMGSAGARSLLGGERLSNFVNNPAFHWQPIPLEKFTIYFEAGTATEKRLDEIKTSIMASRERVLKLIGEKDFPDRIHVFLVDSRPRTKELAGQASFGGAIAKLRVVFAVVNATNNGCSTHEFCHVIAGATWGKPERWLDEGFATYSDERWQNRDVIAAKLAAEGKLLPLETLARDFLRHPSDVTYIEAASFIGFVVERHGMDKFRQIWRGGFKSMPRVLGRTVSELESDWRATLPVNSAASANLAPK